MREELSN